VVGEVERTAQGRDGAGVEREREESGCASAQRMSVWSSVASCEREPIVGPAEEWRVVGGWRGDLGLRVPGWWARVGAGPSAGEDADELSWTLRCGDAAGGTR